MADAAPDQRPLVLLDGMCLAFRAFFALSTDIATSAGLATNALHGFAGMLHVLVRDQRPRGVAVAFDLPGGTFRDAMVEDYKGGRAETPVELEHQFGLIRELCEALAIPVIGVPTFEADDVLATLATRARDEATPVVVVTGDRDTFQLVEDPYVRVLYNRRGVSDYALYDEAGIVERCGVEPARYRLLAALRGDASDNLPGVPGVGEKTAAKLLATYRDFDDLYAHLGDLTPKLRENLAAFEERARTNATVMELVRDVPLDLDPADLTLGGWVKSEVTAFFDRYEMSGSRTRFEKLLAEGLLGPGADAPAGPERAAAPDLPATTAAALAEVLEAPGAVVALRHGRVAAYDPRSGRAGVGGVGDYLGAEHPAPAGHDVKALYRAADERGVDLAEPADDSSIMAFLVDATSGRYALADVAERFLGEAPAPDAPTSSRRRRRRRARRRRAPGGAPARRAARRHRALGARARLREVELPLVKVLGRMEARGVRVDVGLLRSISAEFAAEASRLDAQIQEAAGHEFKVNSSAQLQVVLFDELGLTPRQEEQDRLLDRRDHARGARRRPPDRAAVLRYREVEKLRCTYGASLIDAVQADGRIHATFPRPSRAPAGSPRTARTCTTSPCAPPTGGACATRSCRARAGAGVADYNQIELRILAHLSQDPGLLAAFAGGEDVHRTIAASVFGVAPERRDARAARAGQGRLLRPGLRHGGLRARPAPRHPGRPRQRGHGPLLRGLPDAARLHGRDAGQGARPGLLAHRVRAHPPVPRPGDAPPAAAPGGRAPGDERRDPGPRRRRLQVGAGAPRPRLEARGSPRASSSRSTTRSSSRRRPTSRSASRRSIIDALTHAAEPQRAARGVARVGRELGGRQGLGGRRC